MEVCGTHTMSIFKHGIRTLLPDHIALLSGPGCPVCVTAQNEIDAFVSLSQKENVMIATFGDLLRVPGTSSSLQQEMSRGRDIRMVYSTSDALRLAEKNPDKEVVFLGIGFETTAPTVALSILDAAEKGIANYSVFCSHKRVPPVLTALLEGKGADIDGFLLPGHVSTVIGEISYRPFFDRFRIPSVITGFEPIDILMAVLELTRQIESGTPALVNCYSRAVNFEGNPKALHILEQVFEIAPAIWRGIGRIPESGFGVNRSYRSFDARERFQITVSEKETPKGCACGDILTGKMIPVQCPLYKTKCTPLTPVGPCMVSSEGTCAAYYRYYGE